MFRKGSRETPLQDPFRPLKISKKSQERNDRPRESAMTPISFIEYLKKGWREVSKRFEERTRLVDWISHFYRSFISWFSFFVYFWLSLSEMKSFPRHLKYQFISKISNGKEAETFKKDLISDSVDFWLSLAACHVLCARWRRTHHLVHGISDFFFFGQLIVPFSSSPNP